MEASFFIDDLRNLYISKPFVKKRQIYRTPFDIYSL